MVPHPAEAVAEAEATAASQVGAGHIPAASSAYLVVPHNADAAFTASSYWVDSQPLLLAACLTDSTDCSQVTGHFPPTATAKAEAEASFPQESTAVATAVA